MYLTRREVVRQVADVVKAFMTVRVAIAVRLDMLMTRDQERANYTVNDEHQKWSVGMNGIQIDDLVLLGLKKISKAGVQPVLGYRKAALADGEMSTNGDANERSRD